jgi:GNAT superfamily N-acetyltransferase
MKESILLDAFEVRLADIDKIDPAQLQALSIGVGWPHRAEDWEFLRTVGNGVAVVDKIGRLVGSAMWFTYGDDFVTVGMVITTPRLQANGAGRWVMDYVLSRLGDRSLGLNATAEALRLYVSLGFTLKKAVHQRQGTATAPPSAPLPTGADLRPLEPGDLAALAALDRRAFGADRSPLIARLAEVSSGLVLSREGRIQAFSMCRPFGRGHVVGPIVATTDEEAIAVTRPHVANHAGRFLRVDTRELSGAFADFLGQSGMPVYDTVNSMWLRRPWPITREDVGAGEALTYGLASHSLS